MFIKGTLRFSIGMLVVGIVATVATSVDASVLGASRRGVKESSADTDFEFVVSLGVLGFADAMGIISLSTAGGVLELCLDDLYNGALGPREISGFES